MKQAFSCGLKTKREAHCYRVSIEIVEKSYRARRIRGTFARARVYVRVRTQYVRSAFGRATHFLAGAHAQTRVPVRRGRHIA